MKPLKKFEEYLKTGIVTRRRPELPRARSLIQEAKKRKEFLKEMLDKITITDENANYFIENCYDILIELIRARLITEGYYSSGEGAHEALVSYMRIMEFPEKDVRFMNELRFFRNGIKYYGKSFDKDTAKKVIKFVEDTYPQLMATVNF